MTFSTSRKTSLFVTFAIIVATLFMYAEPIFAGGCVGSGTHGSC